MTHVPPPPVPQSTLSSPYELKPGELVLVKSLTGASLPRRYVRTDSPLPPVPQSTLSSPYELKPGELVLVKSLTGASAKWHRARVNNIQSIEYGTVAIQFIDYGTNEMVHYSQMRRGDGGRKRGGGY